MENLVIYEKTTDVRGFTAQEGFVSFTDNFGDFCITSGHNINGSLKVYSQKGDNEWVPKWRSDAPVSDILDMISKFDDKKEYNKAVIQANDKTAKGEELLISKEDLCFTDTVAGEKSCNGGDYGFYTKYHPTETPGVYFMETSTTCDFDSCGIGPEGYVVLTVEDYRRLQQESDDVEMAGSLY